MTLGSLFVRKETLSVFVIPLEGKDLIISAEVTLCPLQGPLEH